jgi:serine protease Do
MKQYFLKVTALAAIAALAATTGYAQEDKKENNKHNEDVIIIKPRTDKDTKVTIEIKGNDIMVNGKPLSEFKDDDISVSKRKQGVTLSGSFNGYDVMRPPQSRFRGGATLYGGDNMPALAEGNSNKAFLGVTTEKTDECAAITDVTDESAAEKAGLKEGDIITKINDSKIISQEDLTKAIGKFKPEEKVTVTFKRDKKEQKVTATLTKRMGLFSFSSPGNNFNFDSAPFAQSYGYSWGGNKGKLGIKAQETEEGKGLKVLDVDDESPAEKAGIQEGDVITEFDGAEVNNIDKLRELAKTAMGKVAFKVKLNRDGKQQEIDVKIPKNLKTTNL